MEFTDLRANLGADFAGGLRTSGEDLFIAAMVMIPFALALTLVVSATAWWGSLPMIILFLLLAVPATLWNAGWRARTAAQDAAGV